MKRTKHSQIGFVFGATLLGALAGCVGHVDGPHHAGGYAPPPPDYVEREVVVLQDDYVYYPDYQVYYVSSRREYVYLQDGSWVSRPAPPRVPVEVLFASPSVRLDFHDSPSIHHASVVQQYPEDRATPGSDHVSQHGPGEGKNGHD